MCQRPNRHFIIGQVVTGPHDAVNMLIKWKEYKTISAGSISIPEMIFVGDALFPGGNDYPAEEEMESDK
jgi:hypothetical protein